MNTTFLMSEYKVDNLIIKVVLLTTGGAPIEIIKQYIESQGEK